MATGEFAHYEVQALGNAVLNVRSGVEGGVLTHKEGPLSP